MTAIPATSAPVVPQSNPALPGSVITIPSSPTEPATFIPSSTASQEPLPATSTPTKLPSTPIPIQPELITHGDRSNPMVALTFDACETPDDPAGFDQDIIDILSRTNTPATFFLGGLWMQSHPEETRLLASNPLFELGSHSWSHPDFTTLTLEEIDSELNKTEDEMGKLTGRRLRLFRLPFGTYNQQVLEATASHGYYTIQWDVVTGDPDPNITADDIRSAVDAEAQNGSIIIMHVNGRGWHTAEALPGLIEQLRSHGFSLVTISQMLGLDPVTVNQ